VLVTQALHVAETFTRRRKCPLLVIEFDGLLIHSAKGQFHPISWLTRRSTYSKGLAGGSKVKCKLWRFLPR
jgi:hypothetical protein